MWGKEVGGLMGNEEAQQSSNTWGTEHILESTGLLDIIIVNNHYKVEPVCKVEQFCPIIRCRQTVELKKKKKMFH